MADRCCSRQPVGRQRAGDDRQGTIWRLQRLASRPERARGERMPVYWTRWLEVPDATSRPVPPRHTADPHGRDHGVRPASMVVWLRNHVSGSVVRRHQLPTGKEDLINGSEAVSSLSQRHPSHSFLLIGLRQFGMKLVGYSSIGIIGFSQAPSAARAAGLLIEPAQDVAPRGWASRLAPGIGPRSIRTSGTTSHPRRWPASPPSCADTCLEPTVPAWVLQCERRSTTGRRRARWV